MNESSLFKRLEIAEIIQETPSAKSFILRPLDDWKPVYEAGQFLTLVFQTRHGEKRRSFSVSSSPELKELLRITVKKIDNGEFSRLLNYHAKVGDVLITIGFSGHFTLPEKIQAEQYFFLAAGSGITPCYSLIRTLLYKTDKKVNLIYSNRSKEECIFYEDLSLLQKEFSDRFVVRYLFSNLGNVYESRLSNWLLPQFLKQDLLVEHGDALFYLCGPYSYMQFVEITLRSQFEQKQIIKESFDHWPRLILPEPPDREKHKVEIKILGNEYQIEVQFPRSILAAARDKDIALPYSCEAGRCGSCIATCTKGKVWMAYNEILTDSEVERGRVLVCQAYPVGGDARIEF